MSLHVESTGRGPDLVLLHGWGLHSGAWDEVLPALARMARVHAIDLPGHGRSSAVAPTTLDAAALAVAKLTPAGATICGWSLGGLVAQRLAQLDPERACRLVLVASTPCFVARADWPHAMSAETLAAFAHGLSANRDATLASFVRLNALHGAHSRDAIRAFTARLAARSQPSTEALATTLGWLRDTDLRADTTRLALPTLVVHGTRDALAPIAAGRWLAQHVKGAQLHELSDAAHLPFFSHRDDFVTALGAFVG